MVNTLKDQIITKIVDASNQIMKIDDGKSKKIAKRSKKWKRWMIWNYNQNFYLFIITYFLILIN